MMERTVATPLETPRDPDTLTTDMRHGDGCRFNSDMLDSSLLQLQKQHLMPNDDNKDSGTESDEELEQIETSTSIFIVT
ncbi:unnamed protein product [Soboliphyme baturini]|uniref:Uncharacterized protein n=1 Tax=Soboliphyme baturini TaxID=241478 RepID=A0A183IBL5_9BILA|nr:unnamed protein product [Soboliphyme baturini]